MAEPEPVKSYRLHGLGVGALLGPLLTWLLPMAYWLTGFTIVGVVAFVSALLLSFSADRSNSSRSLSALIVWSFLPFGTADPIARVRDGRTLTVCLASALCLFTMLLALVVRSR